MTIAQASTMRKVTVDSFVDFIRATDIFDLIVDTVVFRGQPVAGNLLPSLVRKNPAADTAVAEKKILEQLKLLGASMLDEVGATDLDLLVAAQHYGMKTRLLDWTSNPLAALWFACSSRVNGDLYVYALEADTLLASNVYGRNPFTPPKTRIIQPRLNNPRIVAQQGWFTLHRHSKKTGKYVPLEINPETQSHLHEYRVLEKKRPDLLAALDRHGISARTLFPDLPGLCQHLNWKYGNA